LYGGGGMDVRAERANAAVNSIIWAGYPSQAGGDALAAAIFGQFSPAGRLPVTWYPSEYTSQVPLTDQSMRANSATGNPGRTYKFYMGRPVFPFGHGLTYSEFSYQTIDAPAQVVKISDLQAGHAGRFDERGVNAVSWTVNVTNTGKIASDIVVLAFVASNATFDAVTPPIRELFDYARVHSLMPGASKVLIFGLSYRVFASIDEQGHAWLLPGKYKLAINNEESLIAEFTLAGEPLLVESSPIPASLNHAKTQPTRFAQE